MRVLKSIRGHVIYNPAYTYKFQMKTTAPFIGKTGKTTEDCSLN